MMIVVKQRSHNRAHQWRSIMGRVTVVMISYGLPALSQVSAKPPESHGIIVVGKEPSASLPATTRDLVAMIDHYIERGAYANASKELASLEEKHPDSLDVLFIRARILAGQNNLKQAKKILERLIEENPDYPESYNNLAALYAQTGDLEKSREVLERGISSHKSYAILYENLKSIWAALSKKEYAKALGTKDSQPLPKLKQIAVLDTGRLKPHLSASISANPKGSDQSVVTLDQTTARVDEFDRPMNSLRSVVRESGAQSLNKMPSDVDAKPPVVSLETTIIQTINAWAKSWSRQESNQYLAHYSDDFRPSGRMSRDQWEQQRQSRINAPTWIKIKLSEHKLKILQDGRVQVDVIQSYRSSGFSSIADKRFIFAKKQGKWLIVSEQVLRNRTTHYPDKSELNAVDSGEIVRVSVDQI